MSQQKHKVKKYFNLLKNAQNTAFIGLVKQNLESELIQGGSVRSDKLLKLLHFLLQNVLRCSDPATKNREFVRLKIQEAMVPLVCQKMDSEATFNSILATLLHGLNATEEPKLV